MKMPPSKHTLAPPPGGWKERTFYLVEVAFTNSNPIHQAIFFTGFLSQGQPSGYNRLFNPSWEEQTHVVTDLHYLNVINELPQLNGIAQ